MDPKKAKFFTSKCSGDTYIETLIKAGKKGPGIGTYNPNSPKKILGMYNYEKQKDTGSSSFDEAIFKGQSVPAPYPAINMDKIRQRTMMVKIDGENKTVPKVIKKVS